MPPLDPGDRKLLLIGGAILLVLIGVTLAFAPPPDEQQGEGIPTTYSTSRGGAQAAFLLLQQLGYRSERWEMSPSELPTGESAAGTILIIASPISLPDKDERAALQRFVHAGGWIVYSGSVPFLFLGDGSIAPTFAVDSGSVAQSFPAMTPSPFTRGAPAVTMFARMKWDSSGSAQVPLYGKPDEPVVVTWTSEKGRVLWWSAPTPLTNNGISREGNLAFFLDCIQANRPDAAPAETRVLWDEYYHGYRGSLWDYVRETPVPWAVLQFGLVGMFVLLAFSRRNGPLYVPVSLPRLSPLEFVDTLGDLYRRGNAGPAAVRVAYQRFRTKLVRRLALSPTATNPQLDAAVRERLRWKEPGLIDTLRKAEQASRAREIHGSEALKLVQALEHYEFLFGLKTRPNQEKS